MHRTTGAVIAWSYGVGGTGVNCDFGHAVSYSDIAAVAVFAAADAYRKEHPGAKLGEVISESGFGSRSTYYKVRKQLEER